MSKNPLDGELHKLLPSGQFWDKEAGRVASSLSASPGLCHLLLQTKVLLQAFLRNTLTMAGGAGAGHEVIEPSWQGRWRCGRPTNRRTDPLTQQRHLGNLSCRHTCVWVRCSGSFTVAKLYSSQVREQPLPGHSPPAAGMSPHRATGRGRSGVWSISGVSH